MSNLHQIRSKIKSRDEIANTIGDWRSSGDKIVFTNGCFDIVHLGHVDYLAQASDLGERLVIGVNTDASVSQLKGEHRPVQDEVARTMLLASLQFVDAIVLFGEATPYELIGLVQPDYLVKGSDYKEEDIVGADIVKARNGEVVTIDFLDGYSTSSILERAKSV